MKILVTGSTAYDVLLGYDGSYSDAIDPSALDSLAVSFFSPHYARHHGGTAANIAWNLHLLGADPLTVSTVGSDGGEYKALLEERGIDSSYIEQLDDYVTATAIIGTDAGERQITFFHPGADAHGSFPDLNSERDGLSHAIISPRNAVLMMDAVRWCQKFAVPYLFDPGQQVIGLSDDELRLGIDGSFGLIANEYEWGLIAKRLNMNEENILSKTEHLIVTEGENGVTCFCKEGPHNIGPCKADKVINPTGAGDAFRAGLLYGLSNNWNTTDSLRLGNAMGSFAVEIEGTLLDRIDRDQVWSRCERTYGEKLKS